MQALRSSLRPRLRWRAATARVQSGGDEVAAAAAAAAAAARADSTTRHPIMTRPRRRGGGPRSAAARCLVAGDTAGTSTLRGVTGQISTTAALAWLRVATQASPMSCSPTCSLCLRTPSSSSAQGSPRCESSLRPCRRRAARSSTWACRESSPCRVACSSIGSSRSSPTRAACKCPKPCATGSSLRGACRRGSGLAIRTHGTDPSTTTSTSMCSSRHNVQSMRNRRIIHTTRHRHSRTITTRLKPPWHRRALRRRNRSTHRHRRGQLSHTRRHCRRSSRRRCRRSRSRPIQR